MLKSCRYCGRIHDSKFNCGKKPKHRKMLKETEASAFRRSDAWKKKSLSIRERDHYLCQVCLRSVYMSKRALTYDGLAVHHIVPIEEDRSLALEDSNLITLCNFHHELAESGYIPRGELQEFAAEAPPLP